MLAATLLVIAFAAAWWDLFRSNRGHSCVHSWPNGSSFPYRIRRNTWLNWLINPARSGRHAGIGVGRVVHLGLPEGQIPSAWLLAHEVAHLIRQEGQITRYLVGYVLSPKYRAAEEAACNAWADEHAASFQTTAAALPLREY